MPWVHIIDFFRLKYRLLPNFLSILRILFSPLIVLLVSRDLWGYSTIFFSIAAITDFLDGHLARKWKVESKLGLILDPLADKILIISVLSVLVFKELIPLWFLVIVVFRELAIVLGGFLIASKRGLSKIRPSIWGKLTTVAEIGLFFAILAGNFSKKFPEATIIPTILGLVVILVIFSSFHYLLRTIKES